MGLDQYAYKVKSKYDKSTSTETITKTEIAYWRKHNRLQGWMENLWKDKGGEGTFNCIDLGVMEEDLDELEGKIQEHDLPETDGFFYGNDSYNLNHPDYIRHGYSYEDEPNDLRFITDARKAIKDGYRIVYSCSW